MQESEIYLIIFWENSGIGIELAQELITADGFDVELTTGSLEAPSQMTFVKRLYYQSVTNFCEKISRVGCSELIIGVIKDDSPNYGLVHTTRGYSKVNKNILKLKKKLREKSKISDGVHISDTKKEAEHNLYIAFSITYSDLLKSRKDLRFSPKKIENVQDIFKILNVSMEYVVQRNFHEIFYRSDIHHGDIDLLVKDSEAASILLDAAPATEDPTRKLFSISTGSDQILFDIRDCDENYYPPKWTDDILKRRTLSDCGTYYLPSVEDYIYTLAYHAVFHKFQLSSDYLKQIVETSEKYTDLPLTNWNNILSSLKRFLQKNKYDVSVPKDKTVKLNPFHYLVTQMTDVENITRTSFLPEHHTRNFINDMIAQPSILYQKENAIADVKVITSTANPLNLLVCKIVTIKDPKYAQYLSSEHEKLELLGNKYTPKMFGHFVDSGNHYILMSKLQGASLDVLLMKNASFITQNKEKILNDLNSIETFLKSKGLQHRDIRETNVFITPNAEVKLIDFGLSCSIYDTNAPLPETIKYSGDDATDFARLKTVIRSISNEAIAS